MKVIASDKVMILVKYKKVIHDFIFKAKRITYWCGCVQWLVVIHKFRILSNFGKLEPAYFLCVSIRIAIGLNDTNTIIQNTPEGLFSNLEHTLLVTLPRGTYLFQGHRSKMTVTAFIDDLIFNCH